MRSSTAQKSYLGMIGKLSSMSGFVTAIPAARSTTRRPKSWPEVLAPVSWPWCLGPGVLARCLSIVFGLCVLRLVLAAPEQFGHLHEIGQRTRAHFPHDMATMDLDGDLADPQVARDLLVHQS